MMAGAGRSLMALFAAAGLVLSMAGLAPAKADPKPIRLWRSATA